MTLLVIIIGSSGVGKSSISYRWKSDRFKSDLKPTAQLEVSVHIFDCGNGRYIKAVFWDTGITICLKSFPKIINVC
jgi:GTPase SAR1 family protein